MRIDSLVFNSKKHIDDARAKLDAGDFHSAICLFASAYSDVRLLMEHAWKMKRKAALTAGPAGETVT